ncbi:hypothetical protein N7507_011453 [Penicillium longicatenatum]|nr:hypothetical protein N7507_011453 [Penicillium longicatenatum]
MSNFMHKVKDAMTDRDKDADRFNEPGQESYGSSNAPTNTNTNPSGKTNPFGSTRSGDGATRHTRFNEPQNVGEPTNTGMGSQNIGGSGSDPYASTRAGGATNAGPHDSAMANKMDPRVDSDMDNRANQARTEGDRPNVAQAQGFNPSNTSSLRQQQQQQQPQQQSSMQQPMQQPGMQGFDNHKSSEENYSKSTQEHSSHSQPTSDQMSSQDDYNTSTQENKSHSSTSHAAPCQTNVGGQTGGMGGNAQPNFGGDAAAGGSSLGGTGAGRSGQAQNADPMNKLDPRVTRANEQQNLAGNQRGGY